MGYHCFEVETEDNVAHLRMSRPDELNTLCREFWSELPEIVREIDASASARAIVISSTGRHFTAGLDLAMLAGEIVDRNAEVGRARANLRELVLHLQDSISCLEQVRMPVLAAIQGGCIGGGVDLVTACDMRYCTEDAWFCIQEINIGLTADVGTLQRLPKIVPEGLARELAYTGRRMPATRAREIGLVNEVYADRETMLEAVMQIAREITERSPLAIWGTKEMLNYTRDHSVDEGLDFIATWQSGMFQDQDLAEAFESKREGRSPVYADLLPKRIGP
jgi:enoyl-CoA hydratase